VRSLQSQADKIVRALWLRPRLFLEVLKILLNSKPVLGPWTPMVGGRHGFERYDAKGIPHARVFAWESVVQPWMWKVLDGTRNENLLAEGLGVGDVDVKVVVDAWMRKNGYLLVDEEDDGSPDERADAVIGS
jgi:hypothetical protein